MFEACVSPVGDWLGHGHQAHREGGGVARLGDKVKGTRQTRRTTWTRKRTKRTQRNKEDSS